MIVYKLDGARSTPKIGVLFVDRLVGIECLEEHMSGNNICRVEDIVNEFLGYRNLKDCFQRKNSSSKTQAELKEWLIMQPFLFSLKDRKSMGKALYGLEFFVLFICVTDSKEQFLRVRCNESCNC